MSAAALTAIRDVIQEDPGNRGLRTDPQANLITACPGDFAAACQSLAAAPQPTIGIVTGFFIPTAQPPAGETDGPLGALFLARALVPLGFNVTLLTDAFCSPALAAGLAACQLENVSILELPGSGRDESRLLFQGTHLIALERVGPSHTADSILHQPGGEAALPAFIAEVPEEHRDRCHTMRGLDITGRMAPAHLLFEAAREETPPLTTIGIGDGGNEIGMGKIPWEVIRRNIPGGGLVACRVPTDQLIVCGVSNWGAYGLAAGVRLLRGQAPDPELFDPARERALLEVMVLQGPLVDGVTGRQTATVDGLAFDRYADVLTRLAAIY